MNFFTCVKRVLCMIFFVGVLSAPVNAYNKMVVFGDSLSDNGNLFALTSKIHERYPDVPVIPLSPPYYEGRFTNGLLWVELLANRLNIKEMKNYAYGGAWAESNEVESSGQRVPYSLDVQVLTFLTEAVLDDQKSEHLYVIWSGNNDYLQGFDREVEFATTSTVNAIAKQMNVLYENGARHFLVMNVPDFTLTPTARELDADSIAKLQEMARIHNEKLSAVITAFQAAHADVVMKLGDVGHHFTKLITNPGQYGLKETRQICYRATSYDLRSRFSFVNKKEMQAANTKANLDFLSNPALRIAYVNSKSFKHEGDFSLCSNPDEYLFWDHVHPTRIAHQFIADLAADLFPDTETSKERVTL